MLAALTGALNLGSAARADTLAVGPGQTFDTPCAAIAAAAPNDVIEIASDVYTDSCVIGVTGLTLYGNRIGTNVADQVEYRVYNTDGQLRYRIDGAGDAVAFAYDAAGRNTIEKRYVVAIAPANLPTARLALEAGTATIAQLGGWVPATAGQDQQVTRTFDVAGRMIKQVDTLNNVTRFIYDDAGRQVSTIDPVGAVTRFWFDPAGRHIMTRRFAAPLNGVVW